jgi:hypothetical protein
MPSRSLNDAHPRLAKAYLLSKAEFERIYPHYTVIVTETHRSNEEQDRLYRRPFDKIDNDGDGLVDEKDEKVTNARAGQSKHNAYPSLAIDVAFKNNVTGKLAWSNALFKTFYKFMKIADTGIRWGGHISIGGHFSKMNDAPHFEI